jgi:transcriptional regulator of acetoin/glycerol metabolism
MTRDILSRRPEEAVTHTNAPHHADRVQSALASNEAAQSALVASWKRSATLHNLDPASRNRPKRLSDAELKLARERIEPLVMAAQPSLDRLHQAVGAAGCCLLLADSKGVPVERRGAAGDDDIFEDWGLWTGTVWSEESQGTNGIGTCLVEKRALTIHRDQHFFSCNTLLSCTTAPVFDQEGKLVAALDASSARPDLTVSFVSLVAMAVADAARRIEAENFRLAFPAARIVLPPTGDRVAGALLAVDAEDMVVGATRAARLAFGLNDQILAAGLRASRLLGSEDSDDLMEAERRVLERTLARAGGNVSAAARLLGISRATMHRKLNRAGIGRGA